MLAFATQCKKAEFECLKWVWIVNFSEKIWSARSEANYVQKYPSFALRKKIRVSFPMKIIISSELTSTKMLLMLNVKYFFKMYSEITSHLCSVYLFPYAGFLVTHGDRRKRIVLKYFFQKHHKISYSREI